MFITVAIAEWWCIGPGLPLDFLFGRMTYTSFKRWGWGCQSLPCALRTILTWSGIHKSMHLDKTEGDVLRGAPWEPNEGCHHAGDASGVLHAFCLYSVCVWVCACTDVVFFGGPICARLWAPHARPPCGGKRIFPSKLLWRSLTHTNIFCKVSPPQRRMTLLGKCWQMPFSLAAEAHVRSTTFGDTCHTKHVL